MKSIKDTLLSAGIKNLKEYGYPGVNEKNIMTDQIYSAFFKIMLEGTKGKNEKLDREIDKLIEKIDENTKKQDATN